MACGFNEYELFIIWKVCYRNRWCDKHISRQDIVRGRQSDKIGEYKLAIDSLVTKGILRSYHSQGRDDVCMPKQHRNLAIKSLKAQEGEFAFIRYVNFIK